MNQKKTEVAHISKVKYLGYTFYRYKGKCRARVYSKSVEKMKNKIRKLTDKNTMKKNEMEINAMSEQTIQDGLYSIPVKLDKFVCRSLGVTTIKRDEGT